MEKTLQVYLPYPKAFITQRFGDNANYSYARDGLKGHTAYDWGAQWGVAVLNCVKNAYCYSVMHKNDPDPTKYRAVFTLVETATGLYEVSYGHLSAIYAEVGQTYQVGAVLGRVGNTGDVFDGSHEVTKQERLNGSHAGAHLHGPQIRPVQKVPSLRKGKQYLSDENGTYYKDGFYYEVLNYANGYNGCVSLAPFSTETVAALTIVEADPVKNIVETTASVIDQVQTLPVTQRTPFLQPLADLLASLAKFLNLKK